MKKFSKLLLFVMEVNDSLAKQLVKEAEKAEDTDAKNPNVIAINTAHKEIEKILQYGYELLKEEIPDIEKASKRKHLKLVIGG